MTFLPLTLVLLAAFSAQAELPSDRLLRSLNPTADVNDYAGVLSAAERTALEEQCSNLRQATGAQLAVVILKSLEGGQIDDFASKLFAHWGIGEKEKNNGILIVVALGDRKARIEVGYGLEPILPDALAGRILNEQLFPAFQQQRYAAGLSAAVQRITEIVQRKEPAPANPVQRGRRQLAAPGIPLIIAILTALVAVGSFVGGLGIRRSGGGAIQIGLLLAAVPFLVGWWLAFPWAPLLHTPVGLFMGWLGWLAGRNDIRYPPWMTRSLVHDGMVWPDYSGSTWSGGSSWSSGGGFSGGDWGGFGGGSSGGGGASGGW